MHTGTVIVFNLEYIFNYSAASCFPKKKQKEEKQAQRRMWNDSTRQWNNLLESGKKWIELNTDKIADVKEFPRFSIQYKKSSCVEKNVRKLKKEKRSKKERWGLEARW